MFRCIPGSTLDIESTVRTPRTTQSSVRARHVEGQKTDAITPRVFKREVLERPFAFSEEASV